MSAPRYMHSALRPAIRASRNNRVAFSPANKRNASTDKEPSRTQIPPARPGKANNWTPYAAAGLGLGAVFFYLMGRPDKAASTNVGAQPTGTLPGREGPIRPEDRSNKRQPGQ
ncbi:hypothetical protein SODALDRAFT_326162 [Sodiomyces alkalinus F11]|uniref:Uncharacterized protein n=1 Tax=Sodiomyces alkalinus (strain CBS 110278 / VKM F-3762 / F11) TaxID=1314773 RepID=A0A3N2Q5M1_SODAK|nr:hypothetical protein SODALDRAFT_326162 [Sodiomyces alkalinus F11]ROT41996.1 hypothetical protein SODALDRAFT_326162 [Sodiomyces alkalinus F11]